MDEIIERLKQQNIQCEKRIEGIYKMADVQVEIVQKQIAMNNSSIADLEVKKATIAAAKEE